jgi:hypothetical protein
MYLSDVSRYHHPVRGNHFRERKIRREKRASAKKEKINSLKFLTRKEDKADF